MIVKNLIIGILIIGTFLFLDKNEDDATLLKLILEESNYQKKDSLFLTNYSSTKLIIDFFVYRKNKDRVVHYANKKGGKVSTKKPVDSSYVRYDTVIYTIRPIKRNEYIRKGKGINEKAELFLEDSFNLNEDSMDWNVNELIYNVYPENTLEVGKRLTISKPVYSFDNTKAIIFKRRIITRGSYEDTIYFVEKRNDKWGIVFQQSERTDWMLD